MYQLYRFAVLAGKLIIGKFPGKSEGVRILLCKNPYKIFKVTKNNKKYAKNNNY
jgi:hypothetical protein